MLGYPPQLAHGVNYMLALGDEHYLEALVGREQDLLGAFKMYLGRTQNAHEKDVEDEEEDN